MRKPEILKNETWKFLFGWVKVHYKHEDMRPDLDEKVGHMAKYRHNITILIGWKRLNWVLHTKNMYDLPSESDKAKTTAKEVVKDDTI